MKFFILGKTFLFAGFAMMACAAASNESTSRRRAGSGGGSYETGVGGSGGTTNPSGGRVGSGGSGASTSYDGGSGGSGGTGSSGTGGSGVGGSGGNSSSGGANAGGSGGTSGAAGAAGSGGSTGDLWQPAPGTSWQWQLTGNIDTSLDVQMYDIDLFDTSQATIDELHSDGRIVICYFSAGSSEDWRPDFDQFEESDQGSPLDGWEGERWLDVRSNNVRAIMKDRLDLAVDKDCDGVEPDNVDGYSNDNGVGLTKQDQLDYLEFLSAEAHARGLSIGLKNALGLIDQLVDEFDWALNEECFAYDECSDLSPFIDQGKAVFHVEYGGEDLLDEVCDDASTSGFSTLIKHLDLDAYRLPCP